LIPGNLPHESAVVAKVEEAECFHCHWLEDGLVAARTDQTKGIKKEERGK